jgi:cyclic beta-1,2-glucan synthetase
LPGVRENGGQYTHAAVWCVCAYAQLGMGSQAGDLFALLNPINHALTPNDVSIYKSEPYVLAADIYGQAPHVGRGGWTWYTGSAGWIYRAGTEYLLGIHPRGDSLEIDPCIPAGWDGFKVAYRFKNTMYHLRFENPDHVSKGVRWIEMDGFKEDLGSDLKLKDDRIDHVVNIRMGPSDQ